MKTVYAIQHNTTKRIYVGISNNPEMRIKKHLYALIQGTHSNKEFQKDFDRFGADYSFHILEEGIEEEKALLRERQWINTLRTNEVYRGYNLALGEQSIDDLSRFKSVNIECHDGCIVETMNGNESVVMKGKPRKSRTSTNTSKEYLKYEQFRKENGLSYADVSRQTGISTVALSQWKNGEYNFKLDKLLILAKFFNVPVTEFIE